jgi:uncharacterized protein (DUF1800 family)
MKNLPNSVAAMAFCAAFAGFGQTGFTQTKAPAPRPERDTRKIPARMATRILDQATWGPTPASVAQLQEMGFDAWLNQQFTLNTSDLPDQTILTATGMSNNNLAPVQSAFFANAVNGQDQLRQRVAFALSEIWVVSDDSVPRAYAFPPYWRIFRDNAFGNYRDIAKAITLNPAMGTYLDMANNNKGNPAKNTAANENYARELMQLFTLGLNQLNMDGTPVMANNAPVPTYDNAVVTNVAKILTGWTYPTAPNATAKTNNPAYYFGQMFAVEANHDTSAKTIFNNIMIPAGQTAEQDLDSLLNALMAHPTLAPFISQQLIQHLVTSNPSPAYIERVAQVFQNDGTGTTGNMKAVITAILTDREARAGDDARAPVNASFGHMREPVLLMGNLLRGLIATLGASSAIYNQATQMGQQLFYAPSVFSYFSPQYVAENALPGPEFQIYTTQTAANRADIVNTMLFGTLDKSTTLNLTPFVNLSGNVGDMLNYIGFVFLHDAMSANLYKQAYTAASVQTTAKAKAQAALYVVLTSGEYQIVQ